MAIPEQLVDATFDAWWQKFGRTKESVPQALERTKQQIGGAMPRGYSPPPYRERVRNCDQGHVIHNQAPPQEKPVEPKRTAIPQVIGEKEIIDFIRGGRSEPIEGLFLPFQSDAETEERVRKALSGLLRHSAMGVQRLEVEMKYLSPEERMWLDPRLVEELNRLPCLVDSKKQAARDQAIFDKFYLLDKPQVNMDWEGIRRKRVLQHLADLKYLSDNPIGAGAYGLQRSLNDRGHDHAMRSAFVLQSLFNLGGNMLNARKQGNEHWGNARKQGNENWERYGSGTSGRVHDQALPQQTPTSAKTARPPSTYGFEMEEREKLPPMSRP